MAGQYINHFASVRMRLLGNGTLHSKLISLDETTEYDLPDITMVSQNARYPNILANVNEQKSQLEVRTDAIDEYFKIHEVLIYIKPVASGFPQ